MRVLAALLLSTVSLSAESMGVNAAKVPPVRKQSLVRRAAPGGAGTSTMKMPAKHKAAKGNVKSPAHGSQKKGAIARAVSGGAAASKTPAK